MPPAWRLAYSLDELRNEVNTRWPGRSKVSDGTVGDLSHQASPSDHNPNAAGVVCAFDITNDPSGPSAQYLFDTIRANPQRDCKYLIANRQIASRKSNWVVRSYGGSDPHTSHIHVSVGVGSDGQSVQPYDDRDLWLPSVSPPSPLPNGDDMPLHLIQGKTSDQWWVTDLVTKRYVQSPQQAAEIVVSTRANHGTIECSDQNGPVVYEQSFVDAIPTLS